MQEKLLIRLEQLENLGKAVLNTTIRRRSGLDYIDSSKVNGFKAAALSFIERVYGKEHPYYEGFNTSVKVINPSGTKSGLEILNSIRQEIEGDWLFTVKGLIAAELFADFLEMADHLLEQGYKDPAAVIIGSVLEEHLRQLCSANSIPIEIENNKGVLIPNPKNS